MNGYIEEMVNRIQESLKKAKTNALHFEEPEDEQVRKILYFHIREILKEQKRQLEKVLQWKASDEKKSQQIVKNFYVKNLKSKKSNTPV